MRARVLECDKVSGKSKDISECDRIHWRAYTFFPFQTYKVRAFNTLTALLPLPLLLMLSTVPIATLQIPTFVARSVRNVDMR